MKKTVLQTQEWKDMREFIYEKKAAIVKDVAVLFWPERTRSSYSSDKRQRSA
jgi:hypothetical protein